MKNEIVTPEEMGMSSQRLELIKPAMQSYVDQKQIAGLSTMIARKGKVVHFEQVGQMDIVGLLTHIFNRGERRERGE